MIIDLATNIVVNEPFKEEKFDVITNFFKDALSIEDEKEQILRFNSEIERLILLTEPVIKIVEQHKGKMVESELIEKIQEEYNLLLKIEEIPLIKELTKIYYDKNISQKVVSELSYSIW